MFFNGRSSDVVDGFEEDSVWLAGAGWDLFWLCLNILLMVEVEYPEVYMYFELLELGIDVGWVHR